VPRTLQIHACSRPIRRNIGLVGDADFLLSIECRMPQESPKDTPPAPPPAPAAPRRDDGQGSVVAERKTQRTKPPRMYQVILLNDDYTPMEFVVMVLQEYFKRDRDTATQIMLQIHHEGRGVCGVYSKDVAATKVELVLAAARRAGHPLQCIMEAA
jgi:ATP-dependent Clp protease adaptor protein ClpS